MFHLASVILDLQAACPLKNVLLDGANQDLTLQIIGCFPDQTANCIGD